MGVVGMTLAAIAGSQDDAPVVGEQAVIFLVGAAGGEDAVLCRVEGPFPYAMPAEE